MSSAFLVGAVKSGSGKTLITLGLMQAMKKRGIEVFPFKSGPDFIDPSLHKMVTGRTSYNLDLFMCGERFCKNRFYSLLGKGKGVAVVEGVMGLFDGGNSSSAALAEVLDIPVVLVVDVRAAAESVAAIIHGFETFNKNTRIAGVIGNFSGSENHENIIRKAVKKYCKAELFGFFRKNDHFSIQSRHLGLRMGHEIEKEFRLDELAENIEKQVDIEKLLELTKVENSAGAPLSGQQQLTADTILKSRVRMAVAMDEAFCFYYEDNFRLMKKTGIETVFFSPLRDKHLPGNVQGIYFGGGYPELYGEQLSANNSLIAEIRAFADRGGLIYGECGGFIYLGRTITDGKGKKYRMTGIFSIDFFMEKRFTKLGYRDVLLKKECFLGEKGTRLYGHEFHYSRMESEGTSLENVYESDKKCKGFLQKNTLGSYVHLHFGKSELSLDVLYRMMADCHEIK